jgi:hypothetical protein
VWGLNRDEVGFYLQVYKEPSDYLAQTLSGVRYFYPNAPVFLVSDHGNDYGALCAAFGCTFVMAPFTINVDAGRPPRTFTCELFVARLLRTIDASGGVPYFFYWESDARAVGPLTHAPPNDMMQMFSEHNHWSRETKAKMDVLFPHTQGSVLGWSATGVAVAAATTHVFVLVARGICSQIACVGLGTCSLILDPPPQAARSSTRPSSLRRCTRSQFPGSTPPKSGWP